MTDALHQIHPAAIHHLPPFVTAPGETDALFVGVAIFVLLAVIGIGLFYFKLHALPEQLAHRGQKIQFQLVAVLGLLALFTHNHAFWIAGLLLALMPLPDFTTPLGTIARSLERLADAAAGPPSSAPVAAARDGASSPPAVSARDTAPSAATARDAAPPAASARDAASSAAAARDASPSAAARPAESQEV